MKIAFTAFSILSFVSLGTQALAQQATNTCSAQSGDKITSVIELYTSEGCSSCPPADKWLSTLKTPSSAGSNGLPSPVVQAFHVNYWDYIGWTDRFAAPTHTVRQRQVSTWQNSGQIYTPQMVRNGRDWRNWGSSAAPEAATLSITLKQERDTLFSAQIAPIGADAPQRWAAYWTVTEHGHSSKVLRGENSGEQLKHDFVVRQYQPAGEHQGASKLVLQSPPKDATHPRQINVVVYNPQTGKPLQALSLSCS